MLAGLKILFAVSQKKKELEGVPVKNLRNIFTEAEFFLFLQKSFADILQNWCS